MLIRESKILNGLLHFCQTECPYKKLNIVEEQINEESNEKEVLIICENAKICQNAVNSKIAYNNSRID